MRCTCEVKALRDWARYRDPLVILSQAKCDGRPLVDVPDEDFGNCTSTSKILELGLFYNIIFQKYRQGYLPDF